MPIEFEPYAAGWRSDPWPVYRELRNADRVHWAPESECFCVSRYDDALAVLKDTEVFSSRAMFTVLMQGGQTQPPPLFSWRTLRFLVAYALRVRLNPLAFPAARNLIAADPPVHGPMRNMVNRGFTPRQIAAWEPRTRAVVKEQTARLASGSFDVVADLAIPVPVTIIAEMLGVEPERRADFKRWSDAIIEGATGAGRGDLFNPTITKAVIGLNGYLRKMIRRRRREPADDLISMIIAEEPGGTALDDLEVVLFCQLLLVAGNETTTNLIGNAVHALLEHPDALERVARDPGLVPALIEETLRYESPVHMVFRNTTCDTELAGVRLPEDAVVAVLIGSANRDERRFSEPDRFDLDRNTLGHLGFGFGQHFCLGSSLARLEARLALEAIVPELPRLERCTPERELLDSFLVRGARRLELRPA